ncbi:MAG: hypothetical protein JXD22_00405 [Sedimentisphaerales bacterium]|nr:hypothetical protein [Sedimentisphaerales bacterium]
MILLYLVLFSQLSYSKLVVHLPMDGKGDGGIVAGSELQPIGELSFVPGVVDNAVFLGAGENALIVKDSQAIADNTDSITVACWFRSHDRLEAGSVLVAKDGKKGGWQLTVSRDENYTIRSADSSACFTVCGLEKTVNLYGYSNICDGNWHHIVGIYDGKSLAIYVDGVMENIVKAFGKIKPTDLPITIGTRYEEPERPAGFSTGYIDDVRIYDEPVSYETIAELSKIKPNGFGHITYKKVDLKKDFFDKGVIPIQAHRGGGLSLPENTLETFKETWAEGMIPEADIRTTKEGVIICMHDNDTSRLAPTAPEALKKLTYDQMSLEQVKSLDVGMFRNRPGQKVPTLEEVFMAMQGREERKIYLDYKFVPLELLAKMVSKYDLNEQIIFTSRYHHLIQQWCALASNNVSMIWMGGTEYTLTKIFEQLQRDDFAGISILQIILYKDTKAPEGFTPSIAFLKEREKELEARGIALQVIPWKISDKQVYEKLLSAGFRYYGTDYPEVALRAYKSVLEKN